jgi:serine/threonine-protein kinase
MTSQAAPSVSPSSPAIRRIGRFHIIRELGRGTAGCVYFAHDPVVGRDIALKTFNPRLTPIEKHRYELQFINEARAAGRLSHPHIVTVYDASSENGETYIAMEYLQGRELSRMLQSGRRFTSLETATIIRKIADALDHAHQNAVIHRDIKPENIFMVNDEFPKLVDFGIARAPNRAASSLDSDDDSWTLFHHNVLGTPNYMSPEQARGKDVDARTDIYSLGAVMYEMLTGCKPFASDDVDDLLKKVAHQTPRAPEDIRPAIASSLSRIVMRAMSKQPEKRYETAGQMAKDLKRFIARERALRRMKLPIGSRDANKKKAQALYNNILFLLGCSALTIAAVLIALHFLSRHP